MATVRVTTKPLPTPLTWNHRVCRRCGIEYRPSRNPEVRAKRGDHCRDCADVLALQTAEEAS